MSGAIRYLCGSKPRRLMKTAAHPSRPQAFIHCAGAIRAPSDEYDIVFAWRVPMIRTSSRLALAVLLTAAWSAAQRAPIPQQLAFTPYHGTCIYDVGETVGWTVTPGPVEPTYSYKWTIRRNNAVV